MRVTVPPPTRSPPPTPEPPAEAVLPEMVLLVTANVPPLLMPPPDEALPLVMVRPLRLAPVTPD